MINLTSKWWKGLLNDKSLDVILASLLFLICFLIYFPSLHNEFLIDDHSFTENIYQGTFLSFWDFFSKAPSQHYIPFYYLMNTVLFRTFHDPFILRIINISLFGLSCVTLFFFLKILTRDSLLSLLTALLFCMHPLNAENVLFITNNYMSLYGIFLGLSFITFWISLDRKKDILLKALSLLFFVSGLLTFEWALLFPLHLAISLYFFKRLSFREITRFCQPYFIIALLYAGAWISITVPDSSPITKILSSRITVTDYFATFSSMTFWYISKFLVPSGLVYIKNLSPDQTNHWLWISAGIVMVICYVGFIIKFRRKPLIPFCLLWFLTGFILVIPASFVHNDMGLVIEPHWFFFPSVGIFLLLSAFLLKVFASFKKSAWILLIGLTMYFCFFTNQYVLVSRTEESYARYWLDNSPGNSVAMMTLTRINFDKKKYPLALHWIKETLEKTPLYKKDRVYANAGLISLELGDLPQARSYANRALKENPHYAMAYNILGTLSVRQGEFEKAEQDFIKTVRLNPLFVPAWHNLIDLYILNHQETKALALSKKIVSINLTTTQRNPLLSKLSVLYYKKGNYDKSFDLMNQLIKKDSRAQTFLTLSSAFESMGCEGMAVKILEACLKTYPRNKEAYLSYGRIYANHGEYEEALKAWQEGLKIAPQDPFFRENIERVKKLLENP